MTSSLALLAGTFLYQGPTFSGPQALNACEKSEAAIVARIQSHGISVITSSCAPFELWGSPDSGYEVQILVVGDSGSLRRHSVETLLPCNDARDRVVEGMSRASTPWVAAFCSSRGLQVDTVSRTSDTYHWNLALKTYRSATECEQDRPRVAESFSRWEVAPIFMECQRSIQQGQAFHRMHVSTFGPRALKLGLYKEVPYSSLEACQKGSAESERELERLHLSALFHWCESTPQGSLATHLVFDGYPSRIVRLEGPRYPSMQECSGAIPAVRAHLETEGHSFIRGRCVNQSRGYRLVIDSWRAPSSASSAPEEPLPPQ